MRRWAVQRRRQLVDGVDASVDGNGDGGPVDLGYVLKIKKLT